MFCRLFIVLVIETILIYSCCITARSTITLSFHTLQFPSRTKNNADDHPFTFFSWKPTSKHIIHFPQVKDQTRKDWAQSRDEYFMGLAIQQAYKAASHQEVPIGAILVRPDQHSVSSTGSPASFEILAASHNQVERGIDAIAHAEILCFRAAAKKLSNWRLVNTTLYTTLEPCITCMAAAYAFRIDRVVYGARDFRLGAVTSWVHYDEVMPRHPYHPNGKIAVLGGIREDECATVLRNFFKTRRTEETTRRQESIMGRDMNDSPMRANRSRIKPGLWFTKLKTKIQALLQRIF